MLGWLVAFLINNHLDTRVTEDITQEMVALQGLTVVMTIGVVDTMIADVDVVTMTTIDAAVAKLHS